MANKNKHLKAISYRVSGTHCSSCEIIIEKRILNEKNVKNVDVSSKKGEVEIVYQEKPPTLKKLNNLFEKEGYTFDNCSQSPKENQSKSNDLLTIGGVSLLIILLFILLNRSGFVSLFSINSSSSLPAFFVFGILAGMSTCSALVGGILLSMSRQWTEIYLKTDSIIEKMQPHMMFNLGRILSFGVIGGLLGILGQSLQISTSFTFLLTLVISIFMIIMGLQMVGIKQVEKFKISLPKKITRYVADESNFGTKWMPALVGSLTFLLPCGFTITTQSMALLSGSYLQGALIMIAFGFGTLPALLLIGFSSIKFISQSHISGQFLKIAGVLVLFFAVYNLNSQLNVLGISSFSDLIIFANQARLEKSDFPPIVDGKQVIKMEATAFAYRPDYFKVRAGVPVRWEIIDKGISGCTNAIISRGLFEGEIDLASQTVSIKEFIPQDPGRYKFSCWMGMVSGIIEVVDVSGETNSTEIIDSGASGCSGDSLCDGVCGGGCGNPGCGYAQEE